MDVQTLIAQAKSNVSAANMRRDIMSKATNAVLLMATSGNVASAKEVAAKAKAACQLVDDPDFIFAFNFLKENSQYLDANGDDKMAIDQVAPTVAVAVAPSPSSLRNVAPAPPPVAAAPQPDPVTPEATDPSTKKRGRSTAVVEEDTPVPNPKRAKRTSTSRKAAAMENDDGDDNNGEEDPKSIDIERIMAHIFSETDAGRNTFLGSNEDRQSFATFIRSAKLPSMSALRDKIAAANESKEPNTYGGERISNILQVLKLATTISVKDPAHPFAGGFRPDVLNYNELIATIVIDYCSERQILHPNIRDVIPALTTDY
jgi:hypothetical protein